MSITKSDLIGLAGVDLARFWAQNDMRVLPVAPAPAKRPLIGAWQDKATEDRQVIEQWWRQYPEARVGIATGDPGFDVLDFDVAGGKPGLAQMEKLVDLGIIEPGTFYFVETPSGGRHLCFKGSDQRNKQNEKAIPGVDFRGQGGMVLAAGNEGYKLLGVPHNGLGPISWDAVRDALAPSGTLGGPPTNQKPVSGPSTPPPVPVAPVAIRSGKLRPPPRAFDDPVGEESPLDWVSRTHDIDEMLRSAGWMFVGETGGRSHYRRPGKEQDVSGNVATMADGRRVFYNFSSSTDMPVNQAMSGGQLYTWLFHGGDMRAAASDIRRTLMPTRPLPGPPANSQPPVVLTPPAATHSTETALVAVKDAGQPDIVVDFWQKHQQLRNIRWLARERRVSPWATLGAVLALVSCRLGPHVVLPPIVGGVASLNLLVGLVGPSGKGKGAAWAVAEEFLDVRGRFMTEEVGTSQGIDASFTESVPKLGAVQFNDVAFFYVPEIDTVKAHTDMAGSPLLATLRKVWSGEALGAKYAAKERRRPVRAHAYRASVVAGIQPARSGVLLHDVDGGTPQRWLWLPVHDATAIRRADRLQPPPYAGSPPPIEIDAWIPDGERRGDKDEPEQVKTGLRFEIPVCKKARNEIVDAREQNLISEHSSMDSHSLLTRLKVASLINFLCTQELAVDDWAWGLCTSLMWISNATRAECQRVLEDAEEEEHAKRGRGRAVQMVSEDMARVTLKDRRTDRIVELGSKLLGLLQSTPGREYSPKELREAMGDAKTRRDFGEDVLKALVETLGVVQGPEISSGGRKIRKVSWTTSDLLARSHPE